MDDFSDYLVAALAGMAVMVCGLVLSTYQLNDQAAEWVDISDARQCTDYKGVRNGKLVFACLGGKEYEVFPSVVEQAQKMKQGATP